MKDVKREIEIIVAGYRLVSDRVSALARQGYEVKRVPMGSGGVGQVKEMADHYRIQIGYGVTRHNYAYSVIVKKITL